MDTGSPGSFGDSGTRSHDLPESDVWSRSDGLPMTQPSEPRNVTTSKRYDNSSSASKRANARACHVSPRSNVSATVPRDPTKNPCDGSTGEKSTSKIVSLDGNCTCAHAGGGTSSDGPAAALPGAERDAAAAVAVVAATVCRNARRVVAVVVALTEVSADWAIGDSVSLLGDAGGAGSAVMLTARQRRGAHDRAEKEVARSATGEAKAMLAAGAVCNEAIESIDGEDTSMQMGGGGERDWDDVKAAGMGRYISLANRCSGRGYK